MRKVICGCLLGLLGAILPAAAQEFSLPDAVQVKSFRIIGSRAFSESELLKLVAAEAGKRLDAGDLDSLADRITTFYREHGFLHAQASIPQQNFSSGVIRFVIRKSVGPTRPPPLPGHTFAARPLAAGNPLPAIKASGFRIVGSKAFSEAELLPLVSDAVGKVLTSGDLDSLAQRITAFYRQHGYHRARAVVSTRLPFDGALSQVVEGMIRFLITKLPDGAPLKPEQPETPSFLSAPDTFPGGRDPASVLLNRATWWISRDRPDLAQESLDKLFNMTPDHPDGLAALAQLKIRQQKLKAAQAALDTLKKIQPGHPAIARIEAELRLNRSGKEQLRHARQLAQQARLPGHLDQFGNALEAYRTLYQQYPADGDIALEYWQLVADGKHGWLAARNGLTQLVKDNPDNLHYRLALAEHETSRLPLKRQALQFIIDMTKLPAYAPQAHRSWRRALMQLGDTASSLPLLRQYLAYDQNDTGIRAKETAIVRAQTIHQRLMADPNYRAEVEGLALLDKGQLDAADPLLQQALEARSRDSELVGGVGMLRLRQGRHREAEVYFLQAQKLTGKRNKKWPALVKVAHFWGLMREARDARNDGKLDLAESKLNEAFAMDAKEANAIALLADIKADRGLTGQAIAGYRQALAIAPQNGSALDGLFSIYRRQGTAQAQHFITQLSDAQRSVLADAIKRMELAAVENQAEDADDFLSALERIPANERPDNISRAWGRSLEKLAAAHAESGRRDEAIRLLQEAEPLAAGDETAGLAVASAWGKIGEYRQADRLFESLRAAHPPPSTRWHFRYADYLAMKESPELGAELAAIAALPALSPDETRDLLELQESLALRTAYAQLKADTPHLVHGTLAPFLQANPNRTSLLLADASAYQAEKQWATARADYARVLQLEPGENAARRGLIETLIASGDRAAALTQLDELAAAGPSGNAYYDSKVVDWYLELDEPARAKEQFDTLLAQYPNQPGVLNLAWKMAQNAGQLDEEMLYLKKAIAAEQAQRQASAPQPAAPTLGANTPYQLIGIDEFGSLKKIQRDWKEKKLAELIDRRSRWVSSAIDMRSHSGTPGLSQSNFIEMPLEYKTPWHADDEVFFRTDLVKLDAGSVDPTSTIFGKMFLCQPRCAPTSLVQNTQGMSFTTGYQSNDLSADIGLTPINFPITNIVGGIRKKGDLKQFGYSIEISRRPVTSSLLSYAGTHDPMTGQVWGGVVETGGRLGLSLDKGETFGFWSIFGLHSLTGTNVLSNSSFQLMGGGQWRIINEENRLFSLGVGGSYGGYARNVGEYTFGHGGYYSPQSYRSLSIPVTFGERYPRFSYVLRGSVSVSQSQTQSAPYFPTDSTLQAQAFTLGPTYSGSSLSTSHGYSLESTGEYQVSEQLFVGGMISIIRADNYTPNRMLLYLRYSLDHSAAQPVFFRPKPIEPSSQF